MLDHITFGVADFARCAAFYDKALAPLRIRRLFELSAADTGAAPFVGYGVDRPFFWIGGGQPSSGQLHFAFAAESRAMVDAFYAAAMAAGGADNGPPGIRPDYHPNYYGAFVLDPEGRNIEAVCHTPA